MIESIKSILLNDLNEKLCEYNRIKEQYDKMAEKIKEDNSEEEYLKQKKNLKKEFGLKRFFKSKRYKEKLKLLDDEYNKNLMEFKKFYDEYSEVKRKLSTMDIYGIKKKLEEIPKCDSIKSLKMSKEELINLLDENHIYNSLTEEERNEVEKLR